MKDQFVSYDLALKLKELGFDEPCLTKYGISSLRLYTDYKSCSNKDDIVLSGDFVSAPLWQQAFDWFRDKYRLDSFINAVMIYSIVSNTELDSYKTYFKISRIYGDGSSKIHSEYCDTIQKARQACLEKLIEIIKQ